MAHGLMREDGCIMREESPNTTSTTEEEEEPMLEWECARVQFVQRVVESVVAYNFLSFWLITAFKFYINKALLYFLNRPEAKLLREAEGGNSKLEHQVSQLEVKILDQLKIQYSLLLKNKH
jgi:hypothetical protein